MPPRRFTRPENKILPVDPASWYSGMTPDGRSEKKPKMAPSAARPIFYVGSPPREEEKEGDRSPGKGFLEFLKNCSLCKKMLDHSRVIYMYSDVAFCTHECRQRKMKLDGFNLDTTLGSNTDSGEEASTSLTVRTCAIGRCRFA